jgi:hypothetical protein
MSDASGFAFFSSHASETGPRNIMGDEVKFAPGQKLTALFPVNCHIRLVKNGKIISELESERLESAVESAGVYRVEGWLKLDGEDRPWIYSNPIYMR